METSSTLTKSTPPSISAVFLSNLLTRPALFCAGQGRWPRPGHCWAGRGHECFLLCSHHNNRTWDPIRHSSNPIFLLISPVLVILNRIFLCLFSCFFLVCIGPVGCLSLFALSTRSPTSSTASTRRCSLAVRKDCWARSVVKERTTQWLLKWSLQSRGPSKKYLDNDLPLQVRSTAFVSSSPPPPLPPLLDILSLSLSLSHKQSERREEWKEKKQREREREREREISLSLSLSLSLCFFSFHSSLLSDCLSIWLFAFLVAPLFLLSNPSSFLSLCLFFILTLTVQRQAENHNQYPYTATTNLPSAYSFPPSIPYLSLKLCCWVC